MARRMEGDRWKKEGEGPTIRCRSLLTSVFGRNRAKIASHRLDNNTFVDIARKSVAPKLEVVVEVRKQQQKEEAADCLLNDDRSDACTNVHPSA